MFTWSFRALLEDPFRIVEFAGAGHPGHPASQPELSEHHGRKASPWHWEHQRPGTVGSGSRCPTGYVAWE